MVHIAAAVEDHGLNALRLGTLGHGDAYLLGGVGLGALAGEVFLQGGSGDQGLAGHIVDDLGIDVGLTAEYVQAGTLGRAGNLCTHALVALNALRTGIGSVDHSGTPPFYFLAPVLPALRRMTSSVYLMPLPL